MKVYRVDYGNGDPQITFTTKGVAVKDAKASARDRNQNLSDVDQTVAVYEDTLVPLTKAAIVKLINVSGGYIAEDRVIATFTRAARR